MEMRRGEEKRAVYLPPRSLLIMAGAARYEWQHYIPHRKSDRVQGVIVPRSHRRVSFTFRQVLHLQHEQSVHFLTDLRDNFLILLKLTINTVKLGVALIGEISCTDCAHFMDSRIFCPFPTYALTYGAT